MTTKIGLLGAGQVARSHARAFEDLADCVVDGVYDPDTERAASLVAETPGSRRCTSAEDLLSSNVDAIVISAPTQLHHALGRQVLEAGKHVLMEKPFTRTAKDAHDLDELAERLDLVLMPAQIVRFLPAVVGAAERLACTPTPGPLVQAVERRFTRRTEVFPWWRELPEFLLSHWGSHSLDAILWVSGETVEDVDCWTSSRQSGYEGVDDFTFVAQTTSGGTISLHQTYSSHLELLDWVVVWEQATAAIDGLRSLSWNGDAVLDMPLDTSLAHGFAAQGLEFLEAVDGRAALRTTVQSLLPSLDALDRARDAAGISLTPTG